MVYQISLVAVPALPERKEAWRAAILILGKMVLDDALEKAECSRPGKAAALEDERAISE